MRRDFEPYIPEQIIDYFEPISGLKAKIIGNYLLYINGETVAIIGYPINGEYDEKEVTQIFQSYFEEKKSMRIVIIAPKLPSTLVFEEVKTDNYYRLMLPVKHLSKKIRYMVSRAFRELAIEVGKNLTNSHREIMRDFLNRPDVDEFMDYVCSRLDLYLSRSKTVKIINAFNKTGRLVGFDIVDLPPGRYSFYMFNFIDRNGGYVPGVSDLMMHHFLKISEEEGKLYVNMGLGINEGVKRFKVKWGAEPFLPYQYGVVKRSDISRIFEIFSKL